MFDNNALILSELNLLTLLENSRISLSGLNYGSNKIQICIDETRNFGASR